MPMAFSRGWRRGLSLKPGETRAVVLHWNRACSRPSCRGTVGDEGFRYPYPQNLTTQCFISTVLEERRQDGLTVVQCHGCFDIVHPGHLRYLEFASRQGDILVVTVTGDSQINKGDQRPYIPEELRAESLAALEFVDYVCVDRAPTAVDLLRAVKPDVYVKGREYENI